MTSKRIKYINPFRFYVYAYLRSKDSLTGKRGTPYYIGKGCGDRAYKPHGIVPVPKDKQYIIFLEINLSDIGSQAIERKMILWYGKKIDSTGILVNIQDGGEGSEVSESTKEKLRIINTGKKQSQETINKRKLSNTFKKHTDEVKRNLSELAIEKKFGDRLHTEESNKKRNATLKERGGANLGKRHSKESKEKNRLSHLVKKHSEETKEKMRNRPKYTQEIVTCTHCDRSGGIHSFARYHFDKCKNIKILPQQS